MTSNAIVPGGGQKGAKCRAGLLVLLVLSIVMAASPLHAGQTWQHGTMVNITSRPEGLLVMLDTGVPAGCAGARWGWLLIPESNKVMTATALLMWASNQRSVTVYNDAPFDGSSFCVLSQFDPD